MKAPRIEVSPYPKGDGSVGFPLYIGRYNFGEPDTFIERWERGCASTRKELKTVTTIQIELPDATAQAARDAGLLTPQALVRLINEAIKRRQAAAALLSIADRVAEAGIPPMSMDEINAEVKAARAERRARQAKDDNSSRS